MAEAHQDVPEVPTVEVGELLPKLDGGEKILILDVRNDDEFAEWKLETRKPFDTVHVPYFDFIEDTGGSIAKVPKGRDIVVLCAQGGSSEMVVDMLGEAGIPARNIKGGMVAYGDFLDPVKVPLRAEETARFEIWQINRRGKGCLGYVVRSGTEAVVVDPARHTARSSRQGVRRPRGRGRSPRGHRPRRQGEDRDHRRVVRWVRDGVVLHLLHRPLRGRRDVRRHQRRRVEGGHDRHRQRGVLRPRAEAAVGELAVLPRAQPDRTTRRSRRRRCSSWAAPTIRGSTRRSRSSCTVT